MSDTATAADACALPTPPIYDEVMATLGLELDHGRSSGQGAQAMADRLTSIRLTARVVTALHLLADHDPRAAGSVVSAWMDYLGAGLPMPAHDSLRADALYWSETALELELVEYLAAGMRALTARDFGALLLSARKRLLVAVFQTLPDADRRAFLARVDPRGVFTGRPA